MNRISDTIAGPNLRLKDNLIQLAACIVGAGIGSFVGSTIASARSAPSIFGVVLGGLGGLLVGLFASGIVLMVVGLVRASKRRSAR